MKKEINYAKLHTDTYLPALIKLLGGQTDVGWEKINSLFNKIIEKRNSKAKGETIIVSATIFDIMFHAMKKNNSAILLLIYFNKVFENLSNCLSENEKQLIKPILKNILKSSDHRYWDFVGELTVLCNLISAGKYKLEKIEDELGNGKSTDFYLKEKSNGEIKYVEVLSIHLVSEKVNEDAKLIDKFLRHRITEKIKSKSTNSSGKEFFLVPVIRGEIKDLQIYSRFFQKYSLNIDHVTEPLCFVTFFTRLGQYEHRFGRISKIFSNNPKLWADSTKGYLDGRKKDQA